MYKDKHKRWKSSKWYICGKAAMHKITQIINVKPYQLVCAFDNKDIQEVDLPECITELKPLNNNWTSLLSNPDFFNSVKLSNYGTVVWGQDIDFDPDVLYRMSIPASS